MKIAVFFTYDYQINTLISSGILNRELRIYKRLNEKYNIQFKFFTYDTQKINLPESFEFISIYRYVKRPNNKYLRLLKSLLFAFKLRNLVSDCDLLHQHQLHGAWITLTLKFITKKPLLVRTGYDAYLFSIYNNENYVNQKFNKILTKYALKLSDLYTVTSNQDYKFLKENFKNIKNISLVPNWIEKGRQKNIVKYKNKVLMVGRLESQKNYTEAIKFIEDNKYLTLDIVGTGTEYKDLIHQAKSTNLNINFLGNLDHEKLIELFTKYEYFLSTSKYEGNPKTILEALNSGCIVYASNIKNHEELIQDNKNGFLFENLQDLNKKFNSTFKNQLLKRNISTEAKKSVEKNDIRKIVDVMYKDYVDLSCNK